MSRQPDSPNHCGPSISQSSDARGPTLRAFFTASTGSHFRLRAASLDNKSASGGQRTLIGVLHGPVLAFCQARQGISWGGTNGNVGSLRDPATSPPPWWAASRPWRWSDRGGPRVRRRCTVLNACNNQPEATRAMKPTGTKGPAPRPSARPAPKCPPQARQGDDRRGARGVSGVTAGFEGEVTGVSPFLPPRSRSVICRRCVSP